MILWINYKREEYDGLLYYIEHRCYSQDYIYYISIYNNNKSILNNYKSKEKEGSREPTDFLDDRWISDSLSSL